MLELKKKNVFEASYASGEDGRGSTIIIGHFIRQTDAENAVKGKGCWGSDGQVRQVNVDWKIFEDYGEYLSVDTNRLRKQALQKLTTAEIKALGLEIIE